MEWTNMVCDVNTGPDWTARTKMETLAEFLNIEENQEHVRKRIINALRSRGEWGKYGLFSKIAEPIGFSASYVSKSLTGKKPLRENFVERMAEYLEVFVEWLKGEIPFSYEDARELYVTKYRPSMERITAGLGAVERFGQGLSEEELEEKLSGYDKEFPKVYSAMADVPKERQGEVAEYVLVRAWWHPGFVKKPVEGE